MAGLLGIEDGLQHLQIPGVGVIDAAAVLVAHIVALTVFRQRVNDLEKVLSQVFQADQVRVVHHVHGFGITGGAGAYLGVGGVLDGTVGIAGGDCLHAGNLGKIGLHPPETAAGEVDLPQAWGILPGFPVLVFDGGDGGLCFASVHGNLLIFCGAAAGQAQ